MDNNVETNNGEGEILGSVTHNVDRQNIDKAPLRTSARVSKKLRLDSQNANQEKPSDKKSIPEKTDAKNNDQKSNTSKRINGLWSSEDKNVFFKALNEYGKDFVAIQTHMNNKRNKRGFSQNITKNKDQARHFYYRTWHKISKYVKFPPGVNKVTQELYTLVNFGEFRKRMGFFTEKYAIKLNELIYLGCTQIRVKGKTSRIKTPVCRALRKLNQLEECPGDIQLPIRVLVELRPRDNLTWSKIQALSMNPRVRTTLPFHTRLLSVLDFLQQKWQTPEMKKIKMSSVSNNDGTDGQTFEDCTSLLRVAPKEGLSITAPVIGSGEFITSSRICFLSYEENFLSRTTNVEEMLKQLNINISKGGKQHKSVKKQIPDEDKAKSKTENNEADNVQIEVEGSSSAVQKMISAQTYTKKDTLNDDKETLSFVNNEQNSAKYDVDFSTVRFEKQASSSHKESELIMNCINSEAECDVNGENEDYDNDPAVKINNSEKEQISKAKAGWTIKNVETLRIGDLYLMFGNDSRLQLEYWWEDSLEHTNDTISSVLQKLISVARTMFDKEKVHYRGVSNSKENKKLVIPKIPESEPCANTSTDQVHCRAIGISKENKKCIGFKKLDCKPCKNSPTDQNNATDTKSIETIQLPTDNTGSQDNVGYKKTGIESFREQLSKLQPHYLGRRRRPGDRQTSVVPRMLPTFSTQPQSVQTGVLSHRSNYNNNLPSYNVTAIRKNSAVNSGLAFKELTSPAVISPMLDQDEDTRFSNCSSLTRFLSNVVIPSTSSDELLAKASSENVSISELLNSTNTEWMQNSHWSGLESSNLSYSSLLANLDHSAVQLNESPKLEDDNTSVADSMENSNSSFPLNLSTALFNTNIPSVAK